MSVTIVWPVLFNDFYFKKIEVVFKFIVNKQVFDGAPARSRTADLLITNQ